MQTDSQLEADDMDGGNKSAGRWTQEEHNMFLQGLSTHQKQWKLIAEMVKTRTVVQIRTHAQKYFQKLHKSNGGTGAWKYDKSDDLAQEQEGRSYAYPAADSRAGSFCSSGDSVDSHGTSAEGVDSEGEAHSPRLVGMNVPKKPSNAARSGSHTLSTTDLHSASGSTSCSTSGVNSPNGSSANIFATAKRPTAPKVKGELARKRSRESLKTAQGGANNASAPSPKKSGSTLETNYLKSKSGELDGAGRYFPSIPVGANHGQYYNPSGYSSANYAGSGYGSGGGMPGPLSLPHEDLRMGLELVPDFYFPSQGFEDPINGGSGGYGHALRTMSNDTDLTNHTPHYFGGAFGGSFGCAEHDFDCRIGYHDHSGSNVDDGDDGLMHLLDKIDWDEGEGEGGAHNGTSTADNSRPLSPATDTASSVGSHPRTTSTSGHVHLTNPVVPFALAAHSLANTTSTATNNTNNTNNTSVNYKLSSFSTDAHDATTTATTIPSTSTESVSSELSRLSAEYTPHAPHSQQAQLAYPGAAPASPASMAMSASIATGIAMGSRANYTTNNTNSINNTTTNNTTNHTTATAIPAEQELLQPKHRLAFCSVIDELKLVTKVARSHSNCSVSSTSSDDNSADHISLFDLFQHSSGSTVGRLPPLRSLVQRALDRGVITADPVSTATLTAGIAGYCTSNTTANAAPTTTANNTTSNPTHPTTNTANTANTSSNMDFDDHEFDFSSFMDDSFHYESAEVNNSFDTSMLHNMQYSVGSGGASGSNGMGLGSVSGDTYYSRSVSTSSAGTDLFPESLLDSAISTSPLLTQGMLPTHGATPTATPTIVQRKRGRPRKYSISVPAAPVSTPSATTAKSLLTGPALAHALSTQQYQYNMHYNSDYVVPVNATVLQAFNRAVSGSSGGSGGNGSGRSPSGDHSYSLRHSPTTSNTSNTNAMNTNTSNTSTYLSAGALQQHYNPDIRLGLTRTMSSESDTMMANCFDPKLYDDVSYGVGMLEDFE